MLTKSNIQEQVNYMRLSVVVLLVVFIVSCKITKPYSRPTGVIPGNLYRGITSPDTTSIASLSWKEMFRDTLLQSLISQGISNNTDLRIALARIKSAAANAKQSKLALFPQFDANATATYQEVPSTQFGFPQAYHLETTSSWEAD